MVYVAPANRTEQLKSTEPGRSDLAFAQAVFGHLAARLRVLAVPTTLQLQAFRPPSELKGLNMGFRPLRLTLLEQHRDPDHEGHDVVHEWGLDVSSP